MLLFLRNLNLEEDSLEVDNITIYDNVNQGEIGIYNNHIKFSGLGKYCIYNGVKKDGDFLYSVKNNEVSIFFL